MKDPKPVLKPGIYLGDNGRIFCSDSTRCAGASSLYTGHDISGQRVERVTRASLVAEGYDEKTIAIFRCETCKKGVDDFQ